MRLKALLIALVAGIYMYAPVQAASTFSGIPVIDIAEELPEIKVYSTKEVDCLAQNIYHEARGEPIAGQIAVAQVTMNRVADPEFPKSICGVVKQAVLVDGKPVKDSCQFSWYCDGKPDRPRNSIAMEQAFDIAMEVLYDHKEDITGGATYYHANYVKPKWANIHEKTARIGAHIFYKA